jgi:gas vesicle protein
VSSDRGGEVGLALLLGFAVGAVGALLLAPTPGEDTRRRLGEVAKRFRGDTEGRLVEVKKVMVRTADDIRAAVSAGRGAYADARTGNGGNDKNPEETELEAEPSVGS